MINLFTLIPITLNTNTNINIYRDRIAGEYFRLISDDWTMLDISTDDAEKI